MIEILVYPADEVNEKIKKLEDVIEQSRKEKEWLVIRIAKYESRMSRVYTEYDYKEIILKEMQQALGGK